MLPKALLASLSVFLGLTVGVAAQDLQPAQCLPGWEWNQNSLGQDPCMIASIIEGYCHNDTTLFYTKITVDEWYLPPNKSHSGDEQCDCDTVMYSLIMACATCQQADEYGWDQWSANCGAVLISDLSSYIPQGTAVPHWAYYNVTLLNNQEFDNSNAQSIGRIPEATPNAPPTATPSAGPKGVSKKVSAILGGVIGGIWFLAIVIAAYFGYRWWREKNAKKLRVQEDSLGEYEFDDQWRDQPQSPTKYDQDIPTGQALAPNRLFHMDPPFSTPEHQANPPPTWITPVSNGDRL